MRRPPPRHRRSKETASDGAHTPDALRAQPAPSPSEARWARLTARERETAALCLLKYRLIADRMGISVEGVKKHAQNARAKLGVHDKVGLALYALRMGALMMAPEDGADDEKTLGARADEHPTQLPNSSPFGE